MSREIASRTLSILAGIFCIISFVIGIAVFGIRAVIILFALLIAVALVGAFGGGMTDEDNALILALIIYWIVIPLAAMVFWLVIGILVLVWQGDTYSRRTAILVLGILGVVFSSLMGVAIFLDPLTIALTEFWLLAIGSMILAFTAGILAIIAGAIAVPKGGI